MTPAFRQNCVVLFSKRFVQKRVTLSVSSKLSFVSRSLNGTVADEYTFSCRPRLMLPFFNVWEFTVTVLTQS